MFFGDDSILFYQVNSIEWSKMLSLIRTYEQASRQLLNKEKLSIFFNSNTPHEVRNTIIMIVGTRACGTCEKYLELPSFLGKNRTQHFQFLLNKI